MKFNNIKNIVEDNIEVYKDNTGYKIEGVNNSSAQSRDFGSTGISWDFLPCSRTCLEM